MDSTNRAEKSLKPSEWERLGYVNSPKFRPNDLTREINPVFQYVDELNHRRWKGLTPSGYCRTMEPVCRLASAMLESPASLAFLHAVMCSPRTDIASLSERVGYPCQEFSRSDTSLISDSEDPRKALERLALNIHWVVVDSNEIYGSNARTSATWVPAKIVDNGRHGSQSKIKLRNKLIIHLLQLTRQPDKTIQTLSQQFLIALTLCHEIAHAFNVAVDPTIISAYESEMARRRAIDYQSPELLPYSEPFFENHAHAEIGYCWETEVFGGILMGHASRGNAIEMSKWPNHIPVGLGRPGRPLAPQRRGSKASVTRYFVPAHFIHNVQQQVFWDRLEPVDFRSFRVRKMIGARMKIPEGLWQDDEWEEDKSSEGEWPMDEESWVFRNEPQDVVERLYSTANYAETTEWILDFPFT